ncbi:Txe/YoeB family addiction module toxin [Mucilaginibacter sp. ZT4R22]|uniref:Putative mRNA interferase YoeB n=1 Tax=Mucilaginibacter pankratovii TaxID=2772110 RepID=A0ABR7WTS1_9SPHI|nr:Txe/YoeB family addiction module toxin [Mucilaginibacter pankratovii]MBD1365709.1 Txe/YoeB family addiction module toxin [Mucilaginibacter pankratovii]
MELRLTEPAKDDIRFFVRSGQKAILKKIEVLLIEIEKQPFIGLGKPEPLKHNYSGYWSRRINREHRVVYKIVDNVIFIMSFKGHYE